MYTFEKKLLVFNKIFYLFANFLDQPNDLYPVMPEYEI